MADPFYDHTTFYNGSFGITYSNGLYTITVSYIPKLKPKEWELKPHLEFLKSMLNVPIIQAPNKIAPLIKNIPNFARNSC